MPRQAPSKPGESGGIPVEGNPFTAGLNGQRRKPCIRHQIAASIRFPAQTREDLPMPLPGLDDYTMGLSKQNAAEPQYFFQAAWVHKNFRVGRDSDKTAQDQRRHAVTSFAVYRTIEPCTADRMVGGI
jgi:hypothetical protein